MMYRSLIRVFVALALLGGQISVAEASAKKPPRTNWVVSHSIGLDALVFVGALSGDLLAEQHNQPDVDEVRGKFSTEGQAALKVLDEGIRVRAKGLVGPMLTLYFSAGPSQTLDDLFDTIDNPDRIRATFEASPYWKEKEWQAFVMMLPKIRIVLEELRAAGFEEKWQAQVLPKIEARLPIFAEAVTPYDVIPEQERLLGRKLDPTIEIIVLHYSQPYGIKIVGQKFLTHHSYSPEIQLRTAAHEMFHPPFDLGDEELMSLLKPLAEDKWMLNIVNDHDPRFGYNSFEGIINEDSTKALDQIVAERLGFARDPAKRFVESDEGMHMVAAALYQAMKEDGFDQRGGVYADWLKSTLRRGLLTPDEVRRRAAEVVGEDAVAKWDY